MSRLYRAAAAALLLATALPTPAQDAGPATKAVVAEPAPPPPADETKFEGALGLVLSLRPAYSGSAERKLAPQLAGFLRYGRFTITGAGGFTTRRNDNVERGLDAELVRRDGLRVNLALRFDPGRRESQSDELTGLGDIDATLRARLGLRWEPAPRWQLALGTSVDALGRGGGFIVDGSVSRSFAIDARQRLTLGAGLSAAGARYLQTWYGVDDRQAADSGYPVFRPGAGLRDVHASASWRIEYNPKWAAFTSLSAGRLLGAAADSPLTRQRSNASLSAGIVRRF